MKVVYIGIDWSTQKHDIVYLNEEGGLIVYQTIPHSPAGFEAFDAQREGLGVSAEDCLVGIETEHNLFIDFLSSRSYQQIYVIPPSTIKDTRGRFGASGAKTDRSDAHLIADLVRTDRARLHVWQADSPLTQQITALVSLELFLTRTIVQSTNRLREALWRYYPNATKVFSHLDLPISLEFICEFPTPKAAAGLTFEDFQGFAKAHHYTHSSKLAGCYARLQQPQPAAKERGNCVGLPIHRHPSSASGSASNPRQNRHTGGNPKLVCPASGLPGLFISAGCWEDFGSCPALQVRG